MESSWKWGENYLPRVSKCTYLGIDFQCNGAWGANIEMVYSGRKKANQYSLLMHIWLSQGEFAPLFAHSLYLLPTVILVMCLCLCGSTQTIVDGFGAEHVVVMSRLNMIK